MLNFLLSLLIIALSSGLGVPEKVSQRISEALEAKLENNLNAPNQNADPQENIFGNLNLPDEIQNENAHQNSQQTTETNPDTNKSQTYNTKSGKVVETVANVAINNSPALASCPENPNLCTTPTPQPTPTPIPTSIPTLIPIPSPFPTFIPCPPPPCPPYTLFSDSERVSPEIYPCPVYPDALTSERPICIHEEAM